MCHSLAVALPLQTAAPGTLSDRTLIECNALGSGEEKGVDGRL